MPHNNLALSNLSRSREEAKKEQVIKESSSSANIPYMHQLLPRPNQHSIQPCNHHFFDPISMHTHDISFQQSGPIQCKIKPNPAQ
ncbi:hypothetical protein VTJ04DRAFT_10784 [Mycothermus thermophilus]|uniref:uncharacterized protein n=1 Tax=Humicola insolens TaxID=85995 RepID=UPI0037422C74